MLEVCVPELDFVDETYRHPKYTQPQKVPQKDLSLPPQSVMSFMNAPYHAWLKFEKKFIKN